MQSISLIEHAWELYRSGACPKDIALKINKHRSTVYCWIKGIKLKGIRKFLGDYEKAKRERRQKRKTNSLIKIRIYAIRKKYRDCCGEKIRYWLRRGYGIIVSVSTIYRVLGQKYHLRSKWKQNQVRGPVPKAHREREVIQHDTVDFGGLYAFTSIDIFTKEAQVVIRPHLEAGDGVVALKQ
jgi:IS30 family transposase